MPLRKIGDELSPYWVANNYPYCRNPEHNPPSHIVLQPGVYEHTCPGCGQRQVFNVASTCMHTWGGPATDFTIGPIEFK